MTAVSTHLNVTIDDSLLVSMSEVARRTPEPQAFLETARRYFECAGYMGKEQTAVLGDLAGHFPELASMGSAAYWEAITQVRDALLARQAEGVSVLEQCLPEGLKDPLSVIVHLVPGFVTNYGPTPGHQVFRLVGTALPEEAFLFLLHIYYHELTNVFDTPLTKRAAAAPRTAPLFKHYLLALIRNEGIANYIVLKELLRFRAANPEYHFRYFKYAPLIGQSAVHAQAINACAQILCRLQPANFRGLLGKISELLKDERLPIINLVGIHMAQAITSHYGERRLLNIVTAEPQEFFRLFFETPDAHAVELRGTAAMDEFVTLLTN